MKRPIIPITFLALGTTLAGCASGPVPELRIGPALPDDVTASYDAGAETVTVSKNGAAQTTLAKDGPQGSAIAYVSPYDGSFALRQTTASGKGEVMTIVSPDNTALGIVGVIATRAGAVEVPTAGAANYIGGYTGLFAKAADKNLVAGMTGTTCLTANFGTGSISGAIVGRSPFTDITIPAMPISSGGTFSGAITGGQSPGPGDTASNGQISGMFADVAAGEIVGGLRLDHTISGVDLYEVGGFTTGAGACP